MNDLWQLIDPITTGPDVKLSDVVALTDRFKISGVPVVDNGKLVGIITNRDLRFVTDLTKNV